MSNSRAIAKNVVAAAIVCCVAYFFYRAFSQNWQSLQNYAFEPHCSLLCAAFVAIVGAALLGTLAWQRSINALSGRRPLQFRESFATVNSSGLTKYVPGKVWSYALQMYWLANAGLQKSLVLYVNLLNLALALFSAAFSGLVLLAFASDGTRSTLLLSLAAALLAAELSCFAFHARVFKLAARLVERLFKRQLTYYEFPLKLLVELHVIHLASVLVSGLCTYLTCRGIGGTVDAQGIARMMAAFLLGDVAGFLTLVVPGGIGVREGVMYWLMGGASSGTLALLLPLALRLLGMLSDIALGALAVLLLRKLVPAGSAAAKAVDASLGDVPPASR